MLKRFYILSNTFFKKKKQPNLPLDALNFKISFVSEIIKYMFQNILNRKIKLSQIKLAWILLLLSGPEFFFTLKHYNLWYFNIIEGISAAELTYKHKKLIKKSNFSCSTIVFLNYYNNFGKICQIFLTKYMYV